MKTLKAVYSVMFLLGAVLIVSPASLGQSKRTTRPPVITNSYAIDEGQYGTTWKIYVEAKAADTEMSKIAAAVDQPGFGHHPTDFILLGPRYRNHLKGYLQWNTFSSRGTPREGDQIILKISVIDKAGSASKEVDFPFTFVSGMRGYAKPPAPFDQGDLPRLGYIKVDFVSSEGGMAR